MTGGAAPALIADPETRRALQLDARLETPLGRVFDAAIHE
jgi:hypothetical protein